MKVRKSLGPIVSSGAEFGSGSRFHKTPVPDAGMRITTLVHGKHLIGLVFVCLLLAGCCKNKNLNKNIPLVELGAIDRSKDFANIFCTLLGTEKRPDGSSWGNCSQWLDNPQTATLTLGTTIDSGYRFLLIAGYGSDCLRGPHATFMDSIEHLQSVHRYTAETWPVSAFGSSEFNAKQIAGYLNARFGADQRKYIVLGYSKGTPDLQVALANEPGIHDKVAALVTLSGVVQGSRLSGPTKPTSEAVSPANLQDCTFGDGQGIESMSPAVRQAFLKQHPAPLVPTYSIAAYSRRQHTSKILQPTWDILSGLGEAEDSQMIAAEAVYPGGTYLGLVKRDHWAIAIPFESSLLIDKNDFPRPQLFEAILRFVVADLSGITPGK